MESQLFAASSKMDLGNMKRRFFIWTIISGQRKKDPLARHRLREICMWMIIIRKQLICPSCTLILAEALEAGYDLIILEGLLVLWDEEIYSLLDLKLFVECRNDERIVRRLRRNMTWGMEFDVIAKVYLDLVRYRHDEYVEPTKWKADLILNGSNPSELAETAIIELIRNKIQK